jgi:hypothetical protein
MRAFGISIGARLPSKNDRAVIGKRAARHQ